MINAMLCRIHQSGHLVELAPGALDLVHEGIRTYKQIRQDIRVALPYWPLGFAHATDAYAALALYHETTIYLAVWHRFDDGMGFVDLPFETVLGDRKVKSVEILYPASPVMKASTPYRWSDESRVLHVSMDAAPAARLFVLSFE